MNYQFDWKLVVSGEYGEWIIQGLITTLQISAVSIVLSLVVGTIIAVFRLSKVKPLEWFSLAYTEFFRNTPLLIQIFFWYFGSNSVLPQFVNEWLYEQNFEFAAGVIALTVYTSAFIAEEIRSGIFSIPKTQLESARASGLTFIQSMRFIILPQAYRIIIPPLISQFLNLTKNSSLVMTIGVMDLTYMARQIESYTFHGFEAFTVATVLYICISLVISFVVTMYNKHFLRTIQY
ncbi:amino acid ABC transporter permease [Desulfohalobium retbaense]|uniref:Polar amino acid ABC transporter, inner membrane subunit n=1 Tax=Desulfohalobium retbaense (strain ATCC 49708 / DSM 5692 / JCM 16813 / HR100) TaxID=485915 RepID=C8X4U1_DESRD|nr:amino acid ABC transporter permease [Desulfohalobium retbaense]ACV69438.1 polar amino acid ABC transporter, inner membrane subunit [Desulfohalobium retbaense DSM 5692]